MKKVIFICLLTLSVCFSQPTLDEKAPADKPKTPDVTVTPEHDKASQASPAQTATNSTTVAPSAPAHPAEKAAENPPPATQATNETATKPNETKPAIDNKTDTKPTKDTPKPAEGKVEPPKTSNNETKPVTPAAKPSNGTSADAKDEKKTEATTPKADTVTSTVAPQLKTRAFDGPSFIGGIILTLGLLAIGFMGFKYYKNQTERNYHTL